MTTEGDIKNLALLRVGQTRILDVESSNSQNAEIVNSEYPISLKHCLRLADWSFATVRVILSPDEVPPAFGYTYAFTTPSDFMSVQSVKDAFGKDIKYKIESGKILCNNAALYLTYTSKDKPASDFTPEFISLLKLHLAKQIAFPITLSASITGAIADDYNLEEASLLSLDSQGSDFDGINANQPYGNSDIDFGGIFD